MTAVVDDASESLSRQFKDFDKYRDGFMHVLDSNGHEYWAVMESADKYQGIYVKAYHRQEENHSVVWRKVLFSVAGIKPVIQGGPLHIFGIVTEDEEGDLLQTYTLRDSDGNKLGSGVPFINVFYLPGSILVPQEIRERFAHKK